MLLIQTYLFILGLTLGSFYNVVGLRVAAGESIVRPRSSCPGCGHVLGARELIPVLSYMMQKGKCRSCEARISPLYPIMELLTGILFVLSFRLLGFQLELLVALTLVSLLIIITVSDLRYMIISDKVLLFFLSLLVIERLFIPLTPWWDMLIGGAVGFGLLLLIAILSKGGMGGGDIKLYGVLGLVLGWKLVLVSFFLATLFGAVIGMFGMMVGKVQRGKHMPFGPFIALGVLVAYFYGTELLNWYFTFLI
ncbi:prepilin peptidase [Metabacillus iocasae]|uniref:Leader peptidase (Prepilin peptidase)/N-methyltransferase n=1 Tax=Priestia iocasae TaxID=2291674 RepID=A0ABS2QPI8_9BACI|nr:A24 family peptidase [Metabacillus iocasae]MBM7701357.1 leader peptidase (prepilin peptidase)/N-methyltransferase [Metabacillus iocasae]